MSTLNANPSRHVRTFNPFRPFWGPNTRASSISADNTQLERLSQKLDAAEKKIIEYAQLIAFLYAEQKRYQDIICHSCRENISRASLATASPPASPGFPRSTFQPIPVARSSTDRCYVECPGPSWTTFSNQSTSPCGAYSNNNCPDGLNLATSSCDNPPATVVSPPTTTTAAYSDDADSAPPPAVSSTLEIATNADATKRDWSVEYNPNIKQILNLHVANTFTFTTTVFCVKFSRDGKYLAVGLKNGEIHIHNMVTGSKSILVERSATVFYTEEAKTPPGIWTVRFSLDNKYIATAGGIKGQINIWEVDRRRIRAIFKHKLLVRSLDFSPDGRFLVSASYDKSLCIWRIRDGSRRIISQGTSSFVSVASSPDGRSVASGNEDGLLRIWDARTGRLIAKLTIRDLCSLNMRSMAFTPDGTGVASGDNILRCGDVSLLTGRHSAHMIEDDATSQMNQIWEFRGHKRSITAVSFSSDNLWVISIATYVF